MQLQQRHARQAQRFFIAIQCTESERILDSQAEIIAISKKHAALELL